MVINPRALQKRRVKHLTYNVLHTVRRPFHEDSECATAHVVAPSMDRNIFDTIRLNNFTTLRMVCPQSFFRIIKIKYKTKNHVQAMASSKLM